MTLGKLSKKVFKTASELWPVLISEAGLTGSRTERQGKYDSAFLEDLRALLFPGRTESLDVLFAETRLSAEELLRAFFATLRPFSLMYQDIYEMLSAAEASGSEKALTVRFEFDPGNPLDMLLKDFRRQMERLSEKIIAAPIVKVAYDDLWALVMSDQRLTTPVNKQCNQASSQCNLTKWLDRYKTGVLEIIPDEWRTGRADIDGRLERVVDFANQVVAMYHHHGATTHDLLMTACSDERKKNITDALGYDVQHLWHIESDFWLGQVVRFLIRCRYLVSNDETHDTEEIISNIKSNIDRILPQNDHTTKSIELVRELEDLLDLPVWKHRHEVYAVWLAAQIFQSLKSNGWDFRFHLIDGRLEFAFRGVHLATLTRQSDNSVLVWWTEYTTIHEGLPSRHRTKAIKPDYRILKAPLSAPAPDILIVEAKQHLGTSSREFADALKDYTYACPNAGVLLANYGPIAETLFDRVGVPWNLRSNAYGRIHPGEPNNVQIFRDDIAHVLTKALQGNSEAFFLLSATVQLSWGAQPTDLDIYIWPKGHFEDCVFYGKLNGLNISLSKDVRTGYGPELATIEASSGEYIVAVNQFSNDGTLSNSGARVEIVLDCRQTRHSRSFSAPTSGDYKWWIVATIDMGRKTISEIGTTGLTPQHVPLSN